MMVDTLNPTTVGKVIMMAEITMVAVVEEDTEVEEDMEEAEDMEVVEEDMVILKETTIILLMEMATIKAAVGATVVVVVDMEEEGMEVEEAEDTVLVNHLTEVAVV